MMKKNQKSDDFMTQTLSVHGRVGIPVEPGDVFRASKSADGTGIELHIVGQSLPSATSGAAAQLPPVEVVLTPEDEKHLRQYEGSDPKRRELFIAVRRRELEEARSIQLEKQASGFG